MTTLGKIREYANNHNLIFKDYTKNNLINEKSDCKYQLLKIETNENFKKFNSQKEINAFLNTELESINKAYNEIKKYNNSNEFFLSEDQIEYYEKINLKNIYNL